MTITTSINAVGILGATNLIQSARADDYQTYFSGY